MEYRNQFHKESTERCLKQIEEWKKSPPPSKESAKKQFEMHKRIKEQYPDNPTLVAENSTVKKDTPEDLPITERK